MTDPSTATHAEPGRSEADDRRAIRDLLENWVVYRDSGDWERLRPLWHPDGRMVATWTEGTGDEFIAISQAGWAKGMTVVHRLCGTAIDLNGERALAQTKMTITQRAPVEGVLCDVTCAGRFYDFLEKRAGRWGIVLRQSIYELDRLDPVMPGTAPGRGRRLCQRKRSWCVRCFHWGVGLGGYLDFLNGEMKTTTVPSSRRKVRSPIQVPEWRS